METGAYEGIIILLLTNLVGTTQKDIFISSDFSAIQRFNLHALKNNASTSKKFVMEMLIAKTERRKKIADSL